MFCYRYELPILFSISVSVLNILLSSTEICLQRKDYSCIISVVESALKRAFFSHFSVKHITNLRFVTLLSEILL